MKILLIDDDSDDREMFEEAVINLHKGIMCLTASSAAEARTILKNIQPDLIFLDINMPVVNGWQLLRDFKLNDQLRDIPVYIYSTSSSDNDRFVARELAAAGFITKPDNFKVLESLLKDLLCRLGLPQAIPH